MWSRAPGRLIALSAAVFVGCGSAEPGPENGPEPRARLPWTYVSLGAPPEPSGNPSTPAKIELGGILFHDPILSGDRATACVTCHSQYWGMGDGLSLGIGVGGMGPSGIGRRGATTTRRNVPTLWNAAYRAELFWDGRVSSLEAQVEVPLVDTRELGADRSEVMRGLQENAQYRALFAAAFPDAPSVTEENLARALASFVRTIVSIDAPYDRYARGDEKALTATEVRGMFLFDELGCAQCHVPPLFGADRFEAIKRAPATNVGHPSPLPDEGRFEVTADPRDRSAFRVPGLRNLRETGPYFHDGLTQAMPQAIREMVETTGTRAASEDELVAMSEFIGKGLMDKARVPERPLSVPSGLPVPADGFTIRR